LNSGQAACKITAIPAKVGTGFASGIASKQRDRAFQAKEFLPEALWLSSDFIWQEFAVEFAMPACRSAGGSRLVQWPHSSKPYAGHARAVGPPWFKIARQHQEPIDEPSWIRC
jgi:hypothetical protein